jgi:hypothetical protein
VRFHLIPGCARRLKLHLEFDGPAGSESHEAHHPRDIPKMGHVKMENHGKITDKWNLNQPKYIYILYITLKTCEFLGLSFLLKTILEF